MDKEQKILQRLQELRQEQLKALKELKKVEKAKRKKRRRTVHGFPLKNEENRRENLSRLAENKKGIVLEGNKNTTGVFLNNKTVCRDATKTFCPRLDQLPNTETLTVSPLNQTRTTPENGNLEYTYHSNSMSCALTAHMGSEKKIQNVREFAENGPEKSTSIVKESRTNLTPKVGRLSFEKGKSGRRSLTSGTKSVNETLESNCSSNFHGGTVSPFDNFTSTEECALNDATLKVNDWFTGNKSGSTLVPSCTKDVNKDDKQGQHCERISRQDERISQKNVNSRVEEHTGNITLKESDMLIDDKCSASELSCTTLKKHTNNGLNSANNHQNKRNVSDSKPPGLKENIIMSPVFPCQQVEQDKSLKFPEPDECFLKIVAPSSNFVLPDKDFALLKLKKVRQTRRESFGRSFSPKHSRRKSSDLTGSVGENSKVVNVNHNVCFSSLTKTIPINGTDAVFVKDLSKSEQQEQLHQLQVGHFHHHNEEQKHRQEQQIAQQQQPCEQPQPRQRPKEQQQRSQKEELRQQHKGQQQQQQRQPCEELQQQRQQQQGHQLKGNQEEEQQSQQRQQQHKEHQQQQQRQPYEELQSQQQRQQQQRHQLKGNQEEEQQSQQRQQQHKEHQQQQQQQRQPYEELQKQRQQQQRHQLKGNQEEEQQSQQRQQQHKEHQQQQQRQPYEELQQQRQQQQRHQLKGNQEEEQQSQQRQQQHKEHQQQQQRRPYEELQSQQQRQQQQRHQLKGNQEEEQQSQQRQQQHKEHHQQQQRQPYEELQQQRQQQQRHQLKGNQEEQQSQQLQQQHKERQQQQRRQPYEELQRQQQQRHQLKGNLEEEQQSQQLQQQLKERQQQQRRQPYEELQQQRQQQQRHQLKGNLEEEQQSQQRQQQHKERQQQQKPRKQCKEHHQRSQRQEPRQQFDERQKQQQQREQSHQQLNEHKEQQLQSSPHQQRHKQDHRFREHHTHEEQQHQHEHINSTQLSSRAKKYPAPASNEFSQSLFSQSILDDLAVDHNFPLSLNETSDHLHQNGNNTSTEETAFHVKPVCELASAKELSQKVNALDLQIYVNDAKEGLPLELPVGGETKIKQTNFTHDLIHSPDGSMLETVKELSKKIDTLDFQSNEYEERGTKTKLTDYMDDLPHSSEQAILIQDILSEETQEFTTNKIHENVVTDAPESNCKSSAIGGKSKTLENDISQSKKRSSKHCVLLDESFLKLLDEPSKTNVTKESSAKEVASCSTNDTSEITEVCLEHVYPTSSRTSTKVSAIKYLTLDTNKTKLQVLAVCLPRMLVLWKFISQKSWIVLHKWTLDEGEEFLDLEITMADSCIVVVSGGNFDKALGRVYCIQDGGDLSFDLYKQILFSDIGTTVCLFNNLCLLPTNQSAENVYVVLASTCNGNILLTKWTFDLLCFSSEDSNDFPEITDCGLTSLLVVKRNSCLLLGCVNFDIYLWNHNSCDLLCKIPLGHNLLCKQVCLSSEVIMGMIFLTLLFEDSKTVKLVAINPQNQRTVCLKEFDASSLIEDLSDEILYCVKSGPYIIASLTRGQLLLWDIAESTTKLIKPNKDRMDICCISLHPEESSIAFGTTNGSIYISSYYD